MDKSGGTLGKLAFSPKRKKESGGGYIKVGKMVNPLHWVKLLVVWVLDQSH